MLKLEAAETEKAAGVFAVLLSAATGEERALDTRAEPNYSSGKRERVFQRGGQWPSLDLRRHGDW